MVQGHQRDASRMWASVGGCTGPTRKIVIKIEKAAVSVKAIVPVFLFLCILCQNPIIYISIIYIRVCVYIYVCI